MTAILAQQTQKQAREIQSWELIHPWDSLVLSVMVLIRGVSVGEIFDGRDDTEQKVSQGN